MAFKTTTHVAGGLIRPLSACLLVLGFGLVCASAQTTPPAPKAARSSRWGAAPPRAHALAEDVTRPYAEYQYVPQKGLYKDVTLGDVVGDLSEGYSRTGAAVRQLNNYSGWSSFSSMGGLSVNMGLGIGGFGLPTGGLNWGNGFEGAGTGLNVVLGPLLLDNFYAGYGAIYSDINGNFPSLASLPPDDRFVHIVWLSFRATMVLGDSIAISLQPFVYWLPEKGQVGWGLPGPFAGMMMPNLGPSSLFEATWTKEVGNWRFAAYDQFTPSLFAWNVIDAHLNASASFGDLSPIDRVGRYAVGYGTSDVTNYNPQSEFDTRTPGSDFLSAYYNAAGVRAYGRHGYRTQSMFYFDRIDAWDRHFKPIYAGIRGGAFLQTGDQYMTTYGGYSFSSGEPFVDFFHSVVAGVRKQMTPNLSVYGQAGYYWQTGEGNKDKGWLATVGMQQRLGMRTYHSGEVGRRVFLPLRSAPGIEDYAEYRFNHALGLRSNFSLFAGTTHRNIQSAVENDYVLKYAGAILSSRISQRLNAYVSAAWEESEVESSEIVLERWTYRSGLMYALSENIQSNCFYQYEDVHGQPYNYSEHYLYLGISKRF